MTTVRWRSTPAFAAYRLFPKGISSPRLSSPYTNRFGDYSEEKEKWIRFIESDFYPDNLEAARRKYEPILRRFGELLQLARHSKELYLLIMDEPAEVRTQLLRVFRKYVSPDTSVEMLKRKGRSRDILENFGDRFRSIEEVFDRFGSRPQPDEALISIMAEYEDRGEKGYELTSQFFAWFEDEFGANLTIEGPKRAGKDIDLKDVLSDYPKSRPVDFVVRDKRGTILAVGFARYDSDRGGAQEDDRTGGYGNAIREVFNYSEEKGMPLKVILVNEGPGLLLGSMWRDYAALEDIDPDHVMVCTLRMLGEGRLTEKWIRGE